MKTRVIAIESIQDEDSKRLLAKHGQLTILANNHPDKPSIWATTEFADWLYAALTRIGYVPEDDYIALQGAYLGLAQLITTISTEYGNTANPVAIKVLAYSKNSGNPAYVKTTIQAATGP